MGTLTKNERDGLEEVFLSIHSGRKKSINIKDFYSFLVNKKISVTLSSLLKRAKFGLKRWKF